MEMTESQIKSIVGEVMAKMQLNNSVSGMHGVYADMNTAIEKAKEAQKVVRMLSMDQREKIISRIRTKIKENAETYAELLYQLKNSNVSSNTIAGLERFNSKDFISFFDSSINFGILLSVNLYFRQSMVDQLSALSEYGIMYLISLS